MEVTNELFILLGGGKWGVRWLSCELASSLSPRTLVIACTMHGGGCELGWSTLENACEALWSILQVARTATHRACPELLGEGRCLWNWRWEHPEARTLMEGESALCLQRGISLF